MYIYIYVYMYYIYIYIYICVCVYMYVCIYVCMYTHTRLVGLNKKTTQVHYSVLHVLNNHQVYIYFIYVFLVNAKLVNSRWLKKKVREVYVHLLIVKSMKIRIVYLSCFVVQSNQLLNWYILLYQLCTSVKWQQLTIHQVSKCMSCHKAIVLITGRAHSCHDWIYIYIYINVRKKQKVKLLILACLFLKRKFNESHKNFSMNYLYSKRFGKTNFSCQLFFRLKCERLWWQTH